MKTTRTAGLSSAMKMPRHPDTVILAGLILLNLLLKSLFIGARDIALDEPFTLFLSQQDPGTIITESLKGNNTPLHYLVVHVWMMLTGFNVLLLRSLSLIFSILTLVVIYLTGKKFFSRPVAVVASLMFTFSTFHVYFSHEIRVYPLFTLACAWVIYEFLSIQKEPLVRRHYYLLAAANILMIYCHYLGLIFLGVEFLAWVIFMRWFRDRLAALLSFLAAGLSFLPVLIYFAGRLSLMAQQGSWVREPLYSELYGNLNGFLNGRIVTLVVLLVAAAALFLVIRARQVKGLLTRIRVNRPLIMLTFIFVITYTGSFVISRNGFPIFLDRYLVHLSVPFFILIAAFLYIIPDHPRNYYFLAGFVILAMVLTVNLNPDNNRRVKYLVREVKATRGNAPVVICPDHFDLNFLFYFDPALFRDYRSLPQNLEWYGLYPVRHRDELPATVLDAPVVLYVDADADFSYPGNKVLESLCERFDVTATREFRQDLKVYILTHH